MSEPTAVVAVAQDYAACAGVTLIPAVPARGFGPEVSLVADVLDLGAFLALAGKLGGGVLYLQTTPFVPDDMGDEDDDEDDRPELAAHLVARVGQVGMVTVAFAANGVIHFWEQRASWFQEWQDSQNEAAVDRFFDRRRAGDVEQLDPEAVAALIAEWTQKLLAMPEFRAAKPSARHRFVSLTVPDDIRRQCGWSLTQEVCDQLQTLVGRKYEDIMADLDDLAAELVASPEYQQVSSATARKQVTEQFLIAHADGFSPPTVVRDELYARTRRPAKARVSTPLF